MSPHQCDSLLGIGNSHEVLQELERIGLFVRRIDSEKEWFTYHMLFSKFLQKRLHDLHGDLISSLHARAAHWYWESGFSEDAMHHFLAAEDYDNACLFFDRWAGVLVPDGSLATVDHWSSRIPVLELSKVPSAVTKVAWALMFLNRHNKLAPFTPLLQQRQQNGNASVDEAIAFCMEAILQDDLEGSLTYLKNIEPRPTSHDRFRLFGLSAASNARAYAAMSLGDFDSALGLLSHARMLSERAGATFTLGYTLAKTGLINFSQGHLREVLVQLRSALADTRMHTAESVSKACLACAVVMTLYEANETDAAMEQFTQYRTMIENAGLHDYLVVCYRAVARIHDHQRRPELALEALEHAERQAFANQWPRVVTLLNWERVRRELLSGNLARAKSIADRLESGAATDQDHAWIRFSEETEDAVIGRIRLQIHDGRHELALKGIQRELKSPSVRQRTVRKIKMHVLAALASHGCGDENQAQRSLCQAIELAATGGYIRSFVDEGPLLVHLAQKCLRMQSELPKSLLGSAGVEFLHRLVEAAEARTPSVGYTVQQTPHLPPASGTQQSLLQALTKKETKILSMLMAYMSNEQIAESLFVSKDTVKYHIKNIYGKLNAKNRLEAIRAALALGLDF
jgi:LuxR family maltose regulon positive regulatory protein